MMLMKPKRWHILLLGLLPGVLLAQPKLDVAGGTKLDFGDIYTSSPMKHLVTLKNAGSDTLIISNVSATCGCTGTLITNDHLGPNDTGTLEITFNPKSFKGKIEKGVTFRTNDTSQSNVRITFTGNIVKTLEFEPEYLFIKASVDSSKTDTLTISNEGDRPIRILSVKSSSDLVSLKLTEDEVKPSEETLLISTFNPKTTGTLTGNIEIRTDHPKTPVLNVRLVAWARTKNSSAFSKHN